MRLRLLGLSLLALPFLSRADDYVKPAPVPDNLAPGLTYHLLSETGGRKTYVLVFRAGDEVMSGLSAFAGKEHVQGAHFTGIGGFQRADLAWYDLDRKLFKKNAVEDQVEVTTLAGNIAVEAGKPPLVHVHCAVARRDGTMIGGHLLDAVVRPTLEIYLTAEPVAVAKAHDPATGIELIQ